MRCGEPGCDEQLVQNSAGWHCPRCDWPDDLPWYEEEPRWLPTAVVIGWVLLALLLLSLHGDTDPHHDDIRIEAN